MSDHTSSSDDTNVINFPRLGFTLAPTTPPTAGPDHSGAPQADPAAGPARTGRRSPLDALAALPDPGLTPPFITPTAPVPGHLPDTFRAEPAGDLTGPRLGALSLAACLAVAVAALRGTHTVLSTWRERRMARDAETADLRKARIKAQAAVIEAGAKRAKKVPSSAEFGRKTLGGRSGAKSGGSSGGRGSGGGAGRGGSTGGGAKKTAGGGLSGKNNGSSSRTSGAGTKSQHRKNTSPLGGGSRKKNHGAGGTGGAGGGSKQQKKNPLRTSQNGSKTSLDKQRRKNNGATKNNGSASSGTGLAGALKKDTHKAAARRLNKRRQRGMDAPALWGADKTTKKTPKTPTNLKKQRGPAGSGKNAPNTAATNTAKRQKARKEHTGTNPVRLDQALWNSAKKAAARRWKKHQHKKTGPFGGTPKASAPKAGTPRTRKANLKKNQQQANKQRWAGRWARAQAWARKKAANSSRFPGSGPTATPGPGGTGGYTNAPGGQRQRRSPFQNAGQAAADTATTYTVTSDHIPGSRAKRWEPDAITPGTPALPSTGPAALSSAPTANPPRPGTTAPKEPIPMPPVPARQDPRLAKARHQAARTASQVVGRQMDAQHATEITLDDAIDEYGDFKDDAFATHDQCHKLADRAIKLRDTLIVFADDLATNHNLIGPLFSLAMARMAESMDLVARMAEEMKTSSLQAAEMAESADNDLNDAYRPYNVATADAGLSTPSAPIHNEA